VLQERGTPAPTHGEHGLDGGQCQPGSRRGPRGSTSLASWSGQREDPVDTVLGALVSRHGAALSADSLSED
jgi:hypothetical protein